MDDLFLEYLQDEDLNGGRYKNDDENVSLVSQQRRESSRSFPMESMPLKTTRRRTQENSSAMHVTSLGTMQVNVQTRRRVEMRHNRGSYMGKGSSR
jgi:hypothetical protein